MTFHGNQVGGGMYGKKAEILMRLGIINRVGNFTQYEAWEDREGKFWVREMLPGEKKHEITRGEAEILLSVPE